MRLSGKNLSPLFPALYLVLVAFAAVLAFLAVPAGAAVHTFAEGFETTYYRSQFTQLWWDTVSAQIKLYPFEPLAAGGYNTPDMANGLDISDRYLYVADWATGLIILDVADPETPVLKSTCDTPGPASGVTVEGDYAYVADWGAGIQVIDVSDPASPALVGTCNTPGGAWELAIVGNYAYVADGDSGICVIDITDPTNPVFVKRCQTGIGARALAVAGNYAYVAAGGSGFIVVYIYNPLMPAFAGYVNTPGEANDVAISGNYCYVADKSGGVQIVDISSPESPSIVGSCSTPGMALGVYATGDYLYVASSYGGLIALDIGNPTVPVLLYQNTEADPSKVICEGEYAFSACGDDGIYVVNIAQRVTPPLYKGTAYAPGYGLGVAVDGNYAYACMRDRDFVVFDITDPASPSETGLCLTPGWARGVAIDGDYAYVADGDSGVHVVDITSPDSPSISSTYDTPDYAFAVAVSGDYAFVADRNSGLQVLDIHNPLVTTRAGSYNTPGMAFGVAVSGDYAYVADGSSGLQVIDISDPATPTLAGSYNTPGTAYGVAIQGDYAFVADYDWGVICIDIRDPTAPAYLGRYNTSGYAYRVAVDRRFVYVADGSGGVVQLWFSATGTPVCYATYDTFGEAMDVAIEGDHLFAADGSGSMVVLEILQRFQDSYKYNAYSKVIYTPYGSVVESEIRRVRFEATQDDSILWRVSADSGSTWAQVRPNNKWYQLKTPGTNLMWWSQHYYREALVNPSCTWLRIGWLYDFPEIDSVVDVPADEGGWATLHFTRSGRDFPDEEDYPITQYVVFRRIDDPGLMAGISEGFPPGSWEVVDTVIASQQEQYVCVVPTMADSCSENPPYSVYYISAETSTPSVYYFSPPDSGYSVDNLAPAAPAGLAGEYIYPPPMMRLTWNSNSETDLAYYTVYKGVTEDFEPEPGNLLFQSADTICVDDEFDPSTSTFYKVSATDIHNNGSGYSLIGPEDYADVGSQEPVPSITLLEQNAPNPFSPPTAVRFSLAGAGRARLCVFDVNGRCLEVLLDCDMPAGRHEVVWDGTDFDGKPLASGVYVCRLEAAGYSRRVKMVVLR